MVKPPYATWSIALGKLKMSFVDPQSYLTVLCLSAGGILATITPATVCCCRRVVGGEVVVRKEGCDEVRLKEECEVKTPMLAREG